MDEVKEKVLEKLAREWDDCGGLGGGKSAVNGPTYNMIRGFCEQDAEFAALVLASDKKLSDVLREVHRDAQSGWSDFAVYKRAIGAYCPGAKIAIYMELDLTGDSADGVAFGRDGEVTRDVYGKVNMPRNAAPKKKAEPAKAEQPAKGKKTGKPEKTSQTAKVLPPPDVSTDVGEEKTAKTGTSGETPKVIRFNFMELL